MRARWWLLLSIIFGVLGFTIPYILTYFGMFEVENLSDWFGWIASAGIYGYIGYACWILAGIFFIVALIVFATGGKKKKRRK